MDYLLTAFVLALICLAAWLFYKRWTGRFKTEEPVIEEDTFVEEPEKIPETSIKED